MSYLVLARKYRPKNFAELVGQEHVVRALANALKSGRLHHAYLFTGTRGVGKTTVSRILAKSLNCRGSDGQGGVTDTPCGVCDPCRDIDRGRFVDYTELDAASNRGVDEVQALLEQAVYKPVQGRFKVFMIDEVHMLSGHAFNAMLKTLEEPPEYLKFVLATTDPQKVPVTVLSRCLQFNLRPIGPQTVQTHLADVLASEQVAADSSALRLIARAARGSMRDALSLTDQAIAFGGGQLQEAPVRQMLGSVDRTHVLRLIEALAAGDARSVIGTVEVLRTHGFSAAATLEDMSLLLQRMAVLQAVPPVAGASGPTSGTADADAEASQAEPEAADAARLAAQMPADETQLLYSICLHGRAELGMAPDEYAGLTMVLLRLLAFKPAAAATMESGAGKASSAQKKTTVEGAGAASPSFSRAAPVPAETVPRETDAAPAVASVPLTQVVAARVPASGPPASIMVETALQPLVMQAAAGAFHAGTAPAAAPVATLEGSLKPDDTVDVRLPDAASASGNASAPDAIRSGRDTVAIEPNATVASAATTTEPAESRDPDEADAADHDDFWHRAVQQLAASGAVTALVRELALQSQLIARNDQHWSLRVESASLDQPVSRERLAQALAADGHAVAVLKVEIAAVSDSPARRIAAAAEQAQREALARIEGDPFVQSMMRDYGARIVPGSVRAMSAGHAAPLRTGSSASLPGPQPVMDNPG